MAHYNPPFTFHFFSPRYFVILNVFLLFHRPPIFYDLCHDRPTLIVYSILVLLRLLPNPPRANFPSLCFPDPLILFLADTTTPVQTPLHSPPLHPYFSNPSVIPNVYFPSSIPHLLPPLTSPFMLLCLLFNHLLCPFPFALSYSSSFPISSSCSP